VNIPELEEFRMFYTSVAVLITRFIDGNHCRALVPLNSALAGKEVRICFYVIPAGLIDQLIDLGFCSATFTSGTPFVVAIRRVGIEALSSSSRNRGKSLPR
jgi:hypothetical protein